MLSICCYSGSESPKLQSKFHFVKDHLTERRDVRSIVCKSLSLFRFYLFISVKINVLVHYVLILCFCCQCYSQLAVDFLFCLVLIEVLKQVNKWNTLYYKCYWSCIIKRFSNFSKKSKRLHWHLKLAAISKHKARGWHICNWLIAISLK